MIATHAITVAGQTALVTATENRNRIGTTAEGLLVAGVERFDAPVLLAERPSAGSL